MSEYAEIQQDEVFALLSILSKDEFSFDKYSHTGCLDVHCNLPVVPLKVTVISSNATKSILLNHLPSIKIRLYLPKNYPFESQPHYKIACEWLSAYQLFQLCEALDNLWKESKSEIIYKWLLFIRDDFLSSVLNIKNELQIKIIASEKSNRYLDYKKKYRNRVEIIQHGARLLETLEKYNDFRCKYLASKETQQCGICFEVKARCELSSFGCDHFYCKDCIQNYVRAKLEMNSTDISCPSLDKECTEEASPDQLKLLLTKEDYEAYDELLLKKFLLANEYTVACPRKSCGKPVQPTEKLGRCAYCLFSFCTDCNKAYHGTSCCNIFNSDSEKRKIIERYKDGSEQEKSALIKIYGRKQLDQVLNEVLSKQYVEENSKLCPTCRANIEKSGGCNKVVCSNCGTNFCWLCGAKIMSYNHFTSKESPCYSQLFRGMVAEDGDLEDFEWEEE